MAHLWEILVSSVILHSLLTNRTPSKSEAYSIAAHGELGGWINPASQGRRQLHQRACPLTASQKGKESLGTSLMLD